MLITCNWVLLLHFSWRKRANIEFLGYLSRICLQHFLFLFCVRIFHIFVMGISLFKNGNAFEERNMTTLNSRVCQISYPACASSSVSQCNRKLQHSFKGMLWATWGFLWIFWGDTNHHYSIHLGGHYTVLLNEKKIDFKTEACQSKH